MQALLLLLLSTLGTDPPVVKPGLAQEQLRLAAKYKQFEGRMRQAVDLMRTQDPERAAVVARTADKAKGSLVAVHMERLAALLKQAEDASRSGDADSFARAIREQEKLVLELNELLALLQTDDRSAIGTERRRELERRMKEGAKLRADQRELQAQTDRATPRGDPRLAELQRELAERARRLAPPAKTPPIDRKSPGGLDERMRQTTEAMERAAAELERQRGAEASTAQAQAIQSLEKALAEMSETLRLLRVEERLQTLTSLEARCRRMHEQEKLIFERTLALDKTPVEQRMRADRQKSMELGNRQNAVLSDVEKTLLLIRADGTAVAFDEAFELLRRDLAQVVARLREADTGALTQGLEAAATASLEEMVAALRREIQEARDYRASDGGGPDQRNPLLDRLSELRLVRSLQRQIERRTELAHTMVDGAGALTAEGRAALEGLAERQMRVFETVRELAIERRP